ncbi:trypsin-like peptidase domain-containing protein [Enterococcus rivorum]|uniref:Serine protease n=1 Tax=Enterococcus rivorum TaxID=762845 RepID=A0A1E5L064_9ENTE|nr:trypsin-like peptidase domain-containing protein [Enterococcus rivorum]MBP2099207.1 V8-like Glu-specific endopeptidase/chitodextrinase [Enterococcus rivorum]OEH83473.1 hypothetical protein BCR26_09190 [Enterococcus rivorum]
MVWLKKMMVLTALGTFTGVTLQSSVVMAESLQIESRKVIGEDDRFRISDTSKQPYSSIAYLQIYTSTSNYSRGTAFVVGKDTLVTAGHVIKNVSSELLAKSFVAPGKNNDKEPFGRFEIEKMILHDNYSPNKDHDLAVIKVKPNKNGQSIGDVVPLLSIADNASVTIGSKAIIPGYPTDRRKELWSGDGEIKSQGTYRFRYDVDTIGGNSGGPIFDTNNQVIGVHTTYHTWNGIATENSGLKLTGSNYNFIAKYLDHSTELNDVQAPSQVTGINAKNVTSSSLMLSWEAATDNRGISKYELYVDGKKTATTALTKIEFNRLVANKTYSFAIVAVDDAGNQSQISESYSVTTLPENVEEKPEKPSSWVSTQVYTSGDVVSYQGQEYRAKWWTRNEKPGSADVWQKISSGIDKWQAVIAYTGGNIVEHEGTFYKAKWWTKGEIPGKANVWIKQ